MGNNNQKLPLRKAVSVPDTQSLSAAENFRQNNKGKLGRLIRTGSQDNVIDGNDSFDGYRAEQQVPLSEALFLPDFPIRGDVEELDFEVIEVIAKGAYGNVIKVQREDAKKFHAMKVLDKGQIIKEGAIQQCKDEAAIQSMLGDHPFIVKAEEYWQSRKHLYMVLDYVPHGDLFTLWTFHGFFPEKLVCLYSSELAMVLDYLHNAGVIYRDLKMENILFDPNGHIQLTDFGLAKWLQRGLKTRTICGTLQYMAPEILAAYQYGHEVDWWSLGILVYAMLAGQYPVEGASNHQQMSRNVMDCEYLLPANVSDKAQDVLNKLLTKNPQKRLADVNSFQNLSFFKGLMFTSVIERKISPRTVVPPDFFPMTGESWAPSHIDNGPQYINGFDGFVWKLPPDTVPVYV